MEPVSAPPVRVPAPALPARPAPGEAAPGYDGTWPGLEAGAWRTSDVAANPGGAAGDHVTNLANLDRSARERWAIGVQRTAGNAALRDLVARTVQRDGVDDIPPNPYVIETPGGGARTDIPANPYVDENAPVTLSNARFSGQARLLQIAGGGVALSSADNGPAMRAVQQALIALGFEMVRHGQDGRFGDETREAIGLFRSRRGLTGDQLTARALGELDQSAPPPGEQEEHSFDYERLFEDGYLDITLAVGYDESGTHTDQLNAAHAWLTDRGFTRVEAAAGQPEQFRLRRDVTYPTRAGNRLTREVVVRVSVIGPGAGAARQYGRALADSEITIYDGHARRGIGPDFDADRSPAENFVIGVGSALHAAGRAVAPSAVEQSHYVVNKVNDLEQMTRNGEFDRERYRIWFFNACTTLAYFDELRGGILPAGMDRGNLDLMGTQHPMPLMSEMPATLAMLDGILAAATMEQVAASMMRAGEAVIRAIPNSQITARDRRELLTGMPDMIIHEGAGDNPVAPRP